MTGNRVSGEGGGIVGGAQITSSTITYNTSTGGNTVAGGIYADPVSISYCNLNKNSGYQAKRTGNTPDSTNARNNWWYTRSDIVQIAGMIYDGNDTQGQLGFLPYQPFLTDASDSTPGNFVAAQGIQLMNDRKFDASLNRVLHAGDTAYVQLSGVDSNRYLVNVTVLSVLNKRTYQTIRPFFEESSDSSGIFRCKFFLTNQTHLPDSIAVSDGDSLLIVSEANPAIRIALVIGDTNHKTNLGSFLALNRSQVSFPSLSIGNWKDTTITLKNIGSDTVVVTNVKSTNSSYSVRPTSRVIGPGGTVLDTLRFAPDSPGMNAGFIVFLSNDPTGPDTIWVSGSGEGIPSLLLAQKELNFPARDVGVWMDTVINITNSGTDTLIVSSVTSSKSCFSARPSFLKIAPKSVLTDTIRFSPDSGGVRTANIVFVSNSASSPDTLRVNGTGLTDVLYGTVSIPRNYSLSQNYPNPFNPSTTIRFGIPTKSRVKLTVYNILGQPVAEIVNHELEPGFFQKTWSGNIASGMYFYRIEAVSVEDARRRFVDVKKMILLK